MPRARKPQHPFTMKMDLEVYNRLDKFCEKSGLPKTTAIERALIMYMDAYEKDQEILERHKAE